LVTDWAPWPPVPGWFSEVLLVAEALGEELADALVAELDGVVATLLELELELQPAAARVAASAAAPARASLLCLSTLFPPT
jgi:hypothetical protein